MAPAAEPKPRRTRVERGVYRQPNGKYAVCARHAGRLHFRTCGRDLKAARRAREELIAALAAGKVPASPRLRLDTVATRWTARFEAMVAADQRHPRTLEAHRFHLDHDLLPRLGSRRIASLGVEDIAELITELRAAGRSARQPRTRWRPCRACCASPAAVAGSLPTRSNCWSPRSARGHRGARAVGSSGKPRSSACWRRVRSADGSWSRPRSSAACASRSFSG